MTACLLVLGLTLGCTGGTATTGVNETGTAAAEAVERIGREPRVDAWIAEDKLRHFTLSFAATAMGYGAARVALDADAALPAAGATALALGVMKEVRDARAGQWFSLKDLLWDAAGVAAGIALTRQIR